MTQIVTDAWDPGVSRTGLSVTQNRGGARDGAAMAKLTDGGSSGETEDIGVISVMR